MCITKLVIIGLIKNINDTELKCKELTLDLMELVMK